MPDTKISALTAAATASLTDEVAVNSTLTSRKLTLQKIRDLFAGLFATQAYADAAAAAAVAAVPIPFTHSTSEQVWPFERGLGGEDIKVKTWLGNGFGANELTGLTTANTIISHTPIRHSTLGTQFVKLTVSVGQYYADPTEAVIGDWYITVWYI